MFDTDVRRQETAKSSGFFLKFAAVLIIFHRTEFGPLDTHVNAVCPIQIRSFRGLSHGLSS